MVDRRAHHLDLTALPRDQPDDGPHQHRLAAAGSADQAENLAASYVQREAIDHDVATKANHEIPHANGKLSRGFLHYYIPIDAKNTANSPSSTITRKIDLTTDAVVCLPSDSALP